jgi:hypothetical protein
MPALLQLLESSTAAAAADLACIAAALKRLVDLQQQGQQQQQQQQPAGGVSGQRSKMQQQQQQQQVKAAADSKAMDTQVRQCCQLISALAAQLPAAKQQQQQQQQDAHQASDAASIVWATAQLQHRDSQLSGSCLQVFAAAAESASAADAAAVVTAMAAAGRALPIVFSGCSKELMQQVLQQCTAKLLGSTLHHTTDSNSSSSSNSNDVTMRRERTTSSKLSSTSNKNQNPEPPSLQPGSSESLLLAQRLLQLHAVLQLPPAPADLQQLLAAAAEEEALAAMKDSAATAALVASLAAVAELSQLPSSCSSSSGIIAGPTPAAAAAAAAPRKGSQQKRGQGKAATNSTYGVWGPQQQVQQLLQQLLLDGLLPRLGRATAKQVATSLEAVAQLASEQAVQSELLLSVELPLARDFARGVFAELLASTAAGNWTPAAAAAADDPDMRSQWNQSPAASGAVADVASFLIGWKGEHVAATAAAALQLGVAQHEFFGAVASDILLAAPAAAPAAVAGSRDASDCVGLPEQQQQQQRRCSRLEKFTLQHLIEICCCAAALHCRVEQLLAHTMRLAAQQAAAPAAQQQQQQRKGQQLAAEDLLLLAWCAAEMDVPQLSQPAAELVTAGMAVLQAAAGPNCLQQQQLSAVAARLFQLHVWMSDRQQEQQLAAAGIGAAAADVANMSSTELTTAGAASAPSIGLAAVLSTEQLQQACAAWLQLQTAAPGVKIRLGAVADALQQLPGVEALQLQSVTQDGALVVDLEARVQGIPVAVLLLDDADELLQQDEMLSPSRTTGDLSSSSKAGSRLLDCLCSSRTGDLMFRARALAARGYWVVVVSWQQWLLLDGFVDAEVDYLQSKLWLLEDGGVNLGVNMGENAGVNFGGSLSSGDGGVSSGMPVAAAAAPSEVLQEDE